MNMAYLGNLAILTVKNPAESARQLLALRPGREALWLAFALVVVLNSLVQFGIDSLFSVASSEAPVAPESIVLVLVTSAGALLLSMVAFLMIGRLLGGVGTFNDIMILSVWLQFLQIAALLVTFLVTMMAPFLLLILLLGTALFSIYITVHFLNEAHKFGSLGKSFLVIVLSALVAVPFLLALTPNVPA